MLALEVNFLTGRYTATAYNDRGSPEWPPHPARLYSALVAAHHSTPGAPDEEKSALRWLEQQPPPSIGASEADCRDLVTVFVPVNDTSVTGGRFDEEADEIRELRSQLEALRASGESDPKELKSLEKETGKREAKLRKALEAAIQPQDKVVASALKAARRILPDGRGRQPRTFPSVLPRVPRVVFAWSDVEPPEEVRQALDDLASRVVRLGHSSSFVSLRVVEGPAEAAWRPAPDGEYKLRWIRPGQLEMLEDVHARYRETDPRLLPSVPQGYTQRHRPVPAVFPSGVFGDDWIVLRRTSGPALPISSGPGVARMVRRVLIRFAEEPVAQIISGHKPGGGPSDHLHSAILPLPFVGHDHADGRLMGIALALPRGCGDEERRAFYRALSWWEDSVRRNDEETPELPVHLGDAGTLGLMRVDGMPRETTLRPGSWCRVARRWVSATPVALDRNPGELRSRNPEKLNKAIREASETIAVACERIGLPRPAEVIISPAAPVSGAAKVRAFPAYPDPSGAPRILTHAVLVFGSPVHGPVVLGAGRYHGLGLFRPVGNHDDTDR